MASAWSIVHSHALAVRHGSIALFTSVPIEQRHVHFKMDMRHAFLGYRLSRGAAIQMTLGLGRILNNLALDDGLRLYKLRCRR